MLGTTDIFLFTWGTLRNVALAKKHQFRDDIYSTLFESPQNLDKQELLQMYHQTNDGDLQVYIVALLFIKICRSTPEEDQAFVYIVIGKWLLYKLPELKPSILEKYISALIAQINKLTKLETLTQMAEFIYNFESEYSVDIIPVTRWLECKLITLLLNEASKLKQHMNTERAKLLAKVIQSTSKLGLNLDLPGNLIFENCCDYLICKFDVTGIRRMTEEIEKVDENEIIDLISEIKRIPKISELSAKKVKMIEQFIGREIEFIDYDSATYRERFINTYKDQIDFSLIKWRKIAVYKRQTSNITIKVIIGELPDGKLVAKKTYKHINDENLKGIQREIEILERISNLANAENCFIKFYKSEIKDNSISLYMEGHECTLMSKITELSRNSQRFAYHVIEKNISKMIRAFALLQSLNIYHRDIKPHNLLITKDLNIKIIDFSVSSLISDKNPENASTGVYEIQGTQGYMAPELEEFSSNNESIGKYRPEKTDTFSLGLTIYQMISLKQTFCLNISRESQYETIKRVVYEVETEEWIKIMLVEMLNPDYKIRPSLKECTRFLQADCATIIH